VPRVLQLVAGVLALSGAFALGGCGDDGAASSTGGSAVTSSSDGAGGSSDPSTSTAAAPASGSGAGTGGDGPGGSSPGSTSSGPGGGGGGASPGCATIDLATEVVIGVATSADDFALTLPAITTSRTSWAEAGNEAVVLEISTAERFIGHLVLHQGRDGFDYGMHLGALSEGEEVRARVSSLTAASATPEACVGPAALVAAADLGPAGEGLRNAPVFKWPISKRFDDLPMVLGWSAEKKLYQSVYTSENGGTVDHCGGGAEGMRSELARWGRACDIERAFTHGGAVRSWGRCTGSTTFDEVTPRLEGLHPIFYYGDGHNRLFEDRSGYGADCGSGSGEEADGEIPGWNVQNPGNAAELDEGWVVVVRPLPVSLDELGFAAFAGRREALVDRSAPWLYRITFHELAREGRIDGSQVFPMEQYAYVDVEAADVGGSGDSYCTLLGVDAGFRLRLQAGATTHDGPQMTAEFFGGEHAVKRIAIPLGERHAAQDFTALVFDAYDDDGMYFLTLGDVFIPRPVGDNGAEIDLVHRGDEVVDVYVDDDSSNCPGGENPDGPAPPYPCVGGQHTISLD
jgi:hypothetical protein